jgi:glycosyltransferase involved in cell wall biosynthesis
LLIDVFHCLCNQSFKDFEWVVVDDGSSDDTQEVVNGFIQADKLEIKYYVKENGGKHTAINEGVRQASGELFLILDSDDCLTDDSLEIINSYWHQVKGNDAICGVCGRIAHRDGTLIGSPFEKEYIDMSYLDCRYKYGIVGDMIEVIRTDVMRLFPFPEFPNEKFCPEAIVWNRIGNKYKLRYFNKVVYLRDYLEGGLTDKIVTLRMNSPLASMTCYSELTKYDIPFLQKVKAAINYWRFAKYNRNDNHGITISKLWFWTFPLGVIMKFRDKVR